MITQGNETLFPNWQKKLWQSFEETFGYVRQEWVNKLSNSMTDMMMMMMMMMMTVFVQKFVSIVAENGLMITQCCQYSHARNKARAASIKLRTLHSGLVAKASGSTVNQDGVLTDRSLVQAKVRRNSRHHSPHNPYN